MTAWWALISVAFALSALPAVARAAEPVPALDYGRVEQVHEYLTGSHQSGELVALLGFPLCSELDECRLLAGKEYVSPRIPFSAVKLERVDQERLLHCHDPERGAQPCIIVLYGEVTRGRSVVPHRIEWRVID